MGMSKETITQHLLGRLDASVGMHSRIAKESGVAQATISRIYLRKASPRLDSVEAILAWFERQDRKEKRKSTRRASVRANGVGRDAGVGTAAALGQ